MLKLVLCGMCLGEISPETTVCRRLQTDGDQRKLDGEKICFDGKQPNFSVQNKTCRSRKRE
jgi:hypothetical protein